MSDFIPKPGSIKIGGLSPKAQKLQNALNKAKAAAEGKTDAKPGSAASNTAIKAKSNFAGGKKPNFQRKAV